jgi:predicted permease
MSYRAEFAADTRYALRTFARTRATTAIIVLTLAIGLGATAAIFSVVNAVLLRPLPYAEPDRLVQIVENVPAGETFGGAAVRRSSMNVAELDWWRSNSTTLSDVAVWQREGRTLATAEGSVQLYGAAVSPALFAMRGIAPIVGRGLVEDDERPDTDVVVLAESMWREYLNGDPGIVGRRIQLDGRAYTVVGVMPSAFGDESFWTAFFVPELGGRIMFLGATARLAEGATLDAASAEANALGLRLRGIEPEPGAAPRFEVVRELDQMTAPVAPALRVLVVAVAAVLAIVCTNVANLLLARGTRRQREIAIRRALGATRSRVVRQILTESFVLAGFAAIGAVAFAIMGVSLLEATATGYISPRFGIVASVLPRLDEVAVDPAVLAFVAGLALVAGALFGLLPAVRLSRYGERGHTSAAQLSALSRQSRLGHVLAAVQLAFAMALLIGAGLLVRSFLALTGIDSGFDTRGVLAFELVVPGDATAERKLEVAEELVERLTSQSRIASAGFTDVPPLTPGIAITMAGFVPEGMTEAELREEQRGLAQPEITQTRLVSPGYLRALGARLVEGTWLDERPDGAPAVVVTRSYAERYFKGRSAVGATLRAGANIATIAGVVDSVHLGALDLAPERAIFIDARQMLAVRRALPPAPGGDRTFLTIGGSSIAFAVRSTGDPLAIMADLRGIVRDIDPRLAVDAAVPAERIVAGLATRPRFYAVLLSVFAGIAGFVAVIGIYGVLSYVVGQRTKEIGVRMALGAQRTAVLKLVLKQGALIVGVGVVAGIAVAMALAGYLEGMLFGLKALDLATYVAVGLAFAAVAMLAVYVPARRATVIDPLDALREEGS